MRLKFYEKAGKLAKTSQMDCKSVIYIQFDDYFFLKTGKQKSNFGVIDVISKMRGTW